MSRLLSIGETCRANGYRARFVGHGLAVYHDPTTGEMEVGYAEPATGDEAACLPVSDAKVAAAYEFLTGEPTLRPGVMP